MNSVTSPRSSSRPVLKIYISKLKPTTPSRTFALVFSPSTLWRRLLRPSRKSQSSPGGDVLIVDDSSSSSSVTLVGSPRSEKCTGPKVTMCSCAIPVDGWLIRLKQKVRFDSSPTYFYAQKRIKTPKSPTKWVALRSCLTVNVGAL
jgi:hypothetical protein